MTKLKIAAACLLLAGGSFHLIQSHSESVAAEAAAERFFADPGFTEDHTAAESWQAVEERDASDPLQAMLARGASRR